MTREREELEKLLADAGALIRFRFSQGDHLRRTLLHRRAKGVCHPMCLDWLRRKFKGAMTGVPRREFGDPKYSKGTKLIRQHIRLNRVYKKVKAPGRGPGASRVKENAVLAAFDRSWKAKKGFGRMRAQEGLQYNGEMHKDHMKITAMISEWVNALAAGKVGLSETIHEETERGGLVSYDGAPPLRATARNERGHANLRVKSATAPFERWDGRPCHRLFHPAAGDPRQRGIHAGVFRSQRRGASPFTGSARSGPGPDRTDLARHLPGYLAIHMRGSDRCLVRADHGA